MESFLTRTSSSAKIYFIIFLEGFVSISLEVQLIRQLLPFVGGSVVITSLIIGVFLLFMAIGYYQGSLIKEHFDTHLRWNLSKALLLLGIGMSTNVIYLYFTNFIIVFHANPVMILILYLGAIIAPLMYFLGQTIPLTMNLLPKTRFTGEVGGHVLAISTIGSFLGATLTTTLIMNYFGVAWNIMANCIFLALLTVLLPKTFTTFVKQLIFVIVILILSYTLTIQTEKQLYKKTNSYASYHILTLPQSGAKMLRVNSSQSSMLNKDKTGFPYIETIKRILFDDMHFRHKNILVLGAGGFTLSAQNTFDNHFTYVDIDKQLPEIIKPAFTKVIHGEFVGKDARTYLIHTSQKFDAIVTDTYSSAMEIPSYLLTQEFFNAIKQHLNPQGIALFNIISNPLLSDKFSKRVDNTLRHVFGSCMAMPLRYSNQLTNIIYACQSNKQTQDHTVYTDNLNSSSTDFFNMPKIS